MVSDWPLTSLPRDVESIKKFENLQALVSTFISSLIRCRIFTLLVPEDNLLCNKSLLIVNSPEFRQEQSEMLEQNIPWSQQSEYRHTLLPVQK